MFVAAIQQLFEMVNYVPELESQCGKLPSISGCEDPETVLIYHLYAILKLCLLASRCKLIHCDLII